MSKLRLLLMTGFLAAVIAPLYGCGAECGPGTVEQDGECVLVAKGCGGGTLLSNKQCIVDNSGCGNGTILDGEQCVPDSNSCGENAEFDQSLHVCVPNTEIVCGDGTQPNDQNICEPSGDACADKTLLDEQGRCVIASETCGEGTSLDVNSGKCVVDGDVACGAGLGFDTDSQTCVPTEDLCDAGTAFDADSGLCLPDGCAEGDMLVNGVCMSPLEQDAHNADLTETENNDPALGGTAETLTINPVDGDAFSFAGAIGAPTDLDGDSKLDQDVDVFEFDASAGDWLQIGVQSVGLPAPAFIVHGPNGYVRWSETDLARQTARHIVIPEDGTYSVTVLPSLTLQNPDVGPSGADDWRYVGTLQAISAPSATDHSVSGGPAQIGGELTDLSDNLFTLSGVSANDVLTFTVDHVGEHAEGVLQVWADPATLHHSAPIGAGGKIVIGVPASGSVTVLVDWTKAFGADQDFAVSVDITGDQHRMTIPAGGTESVTVTLAQFDRLIAIQRNQAGAALDVAIVDSSNTEVASETLAPGAKIDQVVFADDTYSVEVTNTSSSDVDAALYVDVTTPVDLGAITSSSSATSPARPFTSGDKAYYVLSAAAGDVVSFSHDNDQGDEIDYAVYDPSGTRVTSGSGVDARSDATGYGYEDVIWSYLDSDVTFLIEVVATASLSGATLDVRSQTPTNAGTLDSQSTVTMSRSATLDAGYSEFHLVDFSEPATFYAALSPGNGESVGFFVYDAALNGVTSGSGSGDLTITGAVDAAGTYLVRVAAAEATSSYDLALNGMIDQQDLGAVASGASATSQTLPVFQRDQTMTLNFSVPAGHVIEISHDNAEGKDHDGALYDASGNQLDRNFIFYPTSSADLEYMYWYTHSGGDFEFVLEGWSATTDQTITVRAIAPGDFGQISSSSSPTMSVSDAATTGQSYFQFLDFTETVNVDGTLSPTNAESLDFALYDLENNAVLSATGSGGDVSFNGTVDEVGTYLVRVEANEAATGFDLTINAVANSVDLGELTAGSEFVSPTQATFDRDRTYTLNFSVPAGHVIELSHDNTESEDHEAFLYDGAGSELDSDYFWYPRTSASPKYIYWYSHDGGDFKFVLEGWSATTNQTVTLRVSSPEDMGQLDAGTSVSVNETETKQFGQSYFKKIAFAQALKYDVTLSPTGGEDLDFALQDFDNNEVFSEEGSGGDIILGGESVVAATSFLVRVDADQAATGFTLTFDNATSIQQDLGSISADSSRTSSPLSSFASGDTHTFTFDVPAGQVIELSHDNVQSAEQTLFLYGPSGEQLLDVRAAYPLSDPSPDYTYWYSETGGTYSVVLEAGTSVTDQTLTVRLSTPTDLGTLPLNQVSSHANSTGLSVGQSHIYLMSVSSGTMMGAVTIVPGSEDTDLYVRTLEMTALASDTSTSPASLADVVLGAGTYVVQVSSVDAVASYDLDITIGAELDASSPGLVIPDGSLGSRTMVSDSMTVSGGCAVVDAVEVYVDINHTYRADLLIDLVSPNGTRVTLHGNTGGNLDDIIGWYPTGLTVDGPGTLGDFSGAAADGDWTLELTDFYGGDTGELNGWALDFTCR